MSTDHKGEDAEGSTPRLVATRVYRRASDNPPEKTNKVNPPARANSCWTKVIFPVKSVIALMYLLMGLVAIGLVGKDADKEILVGRTYDWAIAVTAINILMGLWFMFTYFGTIRKALGRMGALFTDADILLTKNDGWFSVVSVFVFVMTAGVLSAVQSTPLDGTDTEGVTIAWLILDLFLAILAFCVLMWGPSLACRTRSLTVQTHYGNVPGESV